MWTNNVVLLGRVATDIKLLNKNGKDYCRFILYNQKFLPKLEEGVPVEIPKPVKINCVLYGKDAENFVKKTKKGMIVSVIGKLNNIDLYDKPTRKIYQTLGIVVEEYTIFFDKESDIEKEYRLRKIENTLEEIKNVSSFNVI